MFSHPRLQAVFDSRRVTEDDKAIFGEDLARLPLGWGLAIQPEVDNSSVL